ncbi:hypothetical protein [Xenorhabdus bovienii]|uniref:baseplate complex protein n=1 Tax=Xenorhabdus bovienii TaxID=40576 RepID=UPI00237C5360|nr:hypothetical protein [Xenorhabdus bovienii]MDE1481018.1 hypothetical protein [Xenorhabdus bovienii]
MKRYRVANLVVQAINFRIGTFTNEFKANKAKDKQAWEVEFTLREHLSVAEKCEARDVRNIPAKKQTMQGGANAEEGPGKVSLFKSNILKFNNKKIWPA